MNRIDTLHIHNFKFFQNQDPIKLGGNHMLLYGENGSGKSSVYWSLYTLFEASLKPDDIQIQKYFSKTLFKGEDCLVNIHAPETAPGSDDFNSFIELTTDDAQPATYKISVADVGIRGDGNAKQINYASDYINYRQILQFSSFQHSEPIDLFKVFRWSIFYYVRFLNVEFVREGNPIGLTSPAEMWTEIEKGPDEYDFENPEYTDEEFEEYIQSPAFEKYIESFTKAQDELQKLIDYINANAEAYLKKLGYDDFKFVLALKRSIFTFTQKPSDFKVNPFAISLTITEYQGQPKAVKKAHSFLNEARFSAMVIAIRLTILKRKLQENCLKFVVLDDLLISLDMSNREKVIEVLLSQEFSDNYQLIFLTHDFSFFQLCKRKISDAGQTNWINYELYVDEDRKLPVLLPSDTSYAKACNHLKNFDYPAAGNYFRKAAEEIFEGNFPRETYIAENGEKLKNLKNYLDAAIKLYDRVGVNNNNLKSLDNYLFLLLNPLSHRAIDTNVYKTELSRVRFLLPIIVDEVKALNFRELIPSNGAIVIKFIYDANITYEYIIKSADPIYLYNNSGNDEISNSKCTSSKSITIDKTKATVATKNAHYKASNIVDIHKAIYAHKTRAYDNSFLTNIFHQPNQGGGRQSLQHIIAKY
ncbi:MAG: AAA family ATPase [Verrucomicrobia bacterium]|nr:AAA family ATPase [Verrucomicrobiota bacterium]